MSFSNEKCSSSNPNRHPSHLRGRAIGLWYAKRNRSSKKDEYSDGTQSQPIATIQLSPNEIQHVSKVRQLFNSEKEQQLQRKHSVRFSSRIDQDENDTNYLFDLDNDTEHAVQIEKIHSSFQYFPIFDRQPEIDEHLFNDLIAKQDSTLYKSLYEKRTQLPIIHFRQKILNIIQENQVFVLVGETGSGKTTQTAQFILDHEILQKRGSQCRIICSQPRRISATSVAERVAQERGETRFGGSVGYHIRLSAQFPRQYGSILFCTTGMILKYIEKYNRFEHFSHIILDEIHERDIDMDFLLIFIKRLLTLRSDVKIILMSASIQAEKFSSYFNNCPILRIPGNMYPVQEYYLEDYVTKLKYPFDKRTPNKQFNRMMNSNDSNRNLHSYLDELQFDLAQQNKPIEVLKRIQAIGTDYDLDVNWDLVVSVIEYICRISSQGTILVFLPGWGDIVKCTQLIQQRTLLASYLHILPLHSLLPLHNQQEIFNPSPHPNIRKVILSTSIAETSITIDDVIYVVDTGRTKASDYDLETQGKSLLPSNVSKANLIQRKGRAGRTQPGVCYRLFTRCNERLSFLDFPQAEMKTSRLDRIYLQAKLLNVNNISLFLQEALDAPSNESIEHAENFLYDIGALSNDKNQLTPIGRILAHLPLDPQIGKLLIMGHLFSCFDPILTIASILSYRDPFVSPIDKTREIDDTRYSFSNTTMSDHLMLLNMYQEWKNQRTNHEKNKFCHRYFLNINHMKMIDKIRNQLTYLAQDYLISCSGDTNKNKNNTNLICALMCAGLYPNIARIRLSSNKSSKRPLLLETKFERRVLIHPRSINTRLRNADLRRSSVQSTLVVYHEKIRTSNIYLHDMSFISPYALLFFGKSQILMNKNMEETSVNSNNTILVDNWIKINVDNDTNKLVNELKENFNYLLERKASKANTNLHNEQNLIETIINFITKKDENLLLDNKSHDKSSTQKSIDEDWDDDCDD